MSQVIRMCELKAGQFFIWQGTLHKVLKLTDTDILAGTNNIQKNGKDYFRIKRTFGRRSQQKIELSEYENH